MPSGVSNTLRRIAACVEAHGTERRAVATHFTRIRLEGTKKVAATGPGHAGPIQRGDVPRLHERPFPATCMPQRQHFNACGTNPVVEMITDAAQMNPADILQFHVCRSRSNGWRREMRSNPRRSSSWNASGALGRFASHQVAASCISAAARRVILIGSIAPVREADSKNLVRRVILPDPPRQSLPEARLRLPR